MNNLNLENFFNRITEKYPVAMKVFSAWIDIYKVQNNWDQMFSFRPIPEDGSSIYKFHHIPFEMQIGIIVKFIRDTKDTPPEAQYFEEFFIEQLTDVTDAMNAFEEYLRFYDQRFNPDHKATNPSNDDDLPF